MRGSCDREMSGQGFTETLPNGILMKRGEEARMVQPARPRERLAKGAQGQPKPSIPLNMDLGEGWHCGANGEAVENGPMDSGIHPRGRPS